SERGYLLFFVVTPPTSAVNTTASRAGVTEKNSSLKRASWAESTSFGLPCSPVGSVSFQLLRSSRSAGTSARPGPPGTDGWSIASGRPGTRTSATGGGTGTGSSGIGGTGIDTAGNDTAGNDTAGNDNAAASAVVRSGWLNGDTGFPSAGLARDPREWCGSGRCRTVTTPLPAVRASNPNVDHPLAWAPPPMVASAGSLSVRRPRHAACRSRPSLVSTR